MTEADTAVHHLDQAVLRYDDSGVALVAGSVAQLDTEQVWGPRLGPHLVVPRSGGADVLPLTYLTFPDDTAAVLRPVPGGSPEHGLDTHVLLGPATTLTPVVALRSMGWAGWLTRPPVGPELPAVPLATVDDPAIDAALRAQAIAQGDLLARTLGWMLQAPGRPLAVVGCPPAHRPALLWGLQDIDTGLTFDRSFTTFGGAAHEDLAIPHVVFFPGPVPDATAVRRTVVDVHGDETASPQNAYRANALVFRYEFGVDPLAQSPDLQALAVHAPAGAPTALAGTSAPSAPGAAPVAPHGGPPPRTARRLDRGSVDRLANAIAAADGPGEMSRALVELEAAVAGIGDRSAVRAGLEQVGWGVTAVHAHVPFSLHDNTFDRIVRIAFGSGLIDRGSAGPHADARRLAESSPSDDLVRALLRKVEDDGYPVDLNPVVTRRWMHQHAPTPPDPTRGLGPVGRLLDHLGIPISRGTERIVLGALTLLAVVLAFLVGMVVQAYYPDLLTPTESHAVGMAGPGSAPVVAP